MNIWIPSLFCLYFFAGTYGNTHFGCLRNPQLCDTVYQYCVDDGLEGRCIFKQNSFLIDPQELDDPHISQATENGHLRLTPEKRKRLADIVMEVKQFLNSNNIEFSDLTNKQIDGLAQAIAQVFLQQEKDLRAKKQRQLKAFLERLGRDDLTALLTPEQLNFLEKELLNPSTGKSRDQSQTSSNKNSHKKTNNNAQHQSRPSVRKPTINSTSNRSAATTEHQNNLQSQQKPKNDAEKPSVEDTAQVQARNDEYEMPSDSRTVERKSSDDVEVGKLNLAAEQVSAPNEVEFAEKTQPKHNSRKEATYIIVIVVLLVVVLCIIVIAVAIYCMKSAEARNKLLGASTTQSGQDYQALCRQHYASKASEKGEAKQPLIPKASGISVAGRHFSPVGHHHPLYSKGSRNSSQSSWSEEPVTTTLDISTGHTVLAYMEDHLNNKDRLDKEWEALCAYKAENVTTTVAEKNSARNRSQYAVPYDHNRVKLNIPESSAESDYMNASYIIDNDPRWPVYIATQAPLSSTVHHFWQMIWEQGCVVIVMLTPLIEDGISQCARYWPDEGSSTYDDYEIHLVSEHIWCEDYLVRSLYLKNLNTNETRTVTQFHFLSWPADGVPSSSKPLLELRRKVSKCYRGNALSPIVVHCSDGCGRTGSYMLLDLVIARMVKGTCKEIDIAATLEHLRDQRAGRIVATKKQLEFVLSCVADEVNAILKVLLQ